MVEAHRYQDLIRLFNACFEVSHKTKLVKGGDEPIYLPADETRPYHAIYFARGFFSSALHECAHWFIAGHARRQLVDFGYWYVPDGRTAEQQQRFQQVEVKPQAIEWILSDAARYRFHFSHDNLQGELSDNNAFEEAVYQQVLHYKQHGLPARAALFCRALHAFYHAPRNSPCSSAGK